MALRTVGFVAAYVVAREPKRPPTAEEACVSTMLRQMTAPPVGPAEAGPAGPRRSSVVAAGLIALSLACLAVPAVVGFRQHRDALACQNTMREFHVALDEYAGANDGRYPRLAAGHSATDTLATLKEAGLLDDAARLRCAAAGGSDYVYALGYHDTSGEWRGLTQPPADQRQPVVADAPVYRASGAGVRSPGHRRGCNVLFVGGDVRCAPRRALGWTATTSS